MTDSREETYTSGNQPDSQPGSFCWLEHIAETLFQQNSSTLTAAMTAALRDDNPHFRLRLIKLLNDLRDNRTLPLLLVALHDESHLVVQAAYIGFAKLVLPHLPIDHQRVRRTQSDCLRRLLIEHLMKILRPESSEYMAHFLAYDADVTNRKLAAQGLGQHGRADFIPILINALADYDQGVQIAAVRSLGEIADATALADVLRLTDNAIDPKLRAAAFIALGNIGCNIVLARWIDLRINARQAVEILSTDFRDLGKRIMPVVIQGLMAPEPVVRHAALKAFIMMSFSEDELNFLDSEGSDDTPPRQWPYLN